jgi:AraC-like DNA-binding protein
MASLWSYIFLDPEELFRNFIMNQEISPADLEDFPVLIIKQEDRPDLYFLLTMIIDQLKQQKPNFRASTKGLLLALCMEFLRLKGSTQQRDLPNEPPENALVISPALDYIRDNYMNSFPIQTLVDLCHLSGTHFRRVFHEIMGISPLEYINVIRINKACMLMRTTESTILSVSEQVGFHSVSSFNRYFIRMIGISPRAWRTRMLQTETKEMWQRQSILNFNGWR